jgi:hypothetical protein
MADADAPEEQAGAADHLFQVGDWPAEGTLLGRMPEKGTAGPIVVSNEFADVVVTQVRSRNGVRLDIWSPRRGSRIQLDAVALDCLSYQSPDVITQMLAEKPGG